MKKHNLMAAIPAVILLISPACGRHKQDTTSQIPDIDVASVVTDTVTLYKHFPGTLSASASVRVVARVNGTITGKYYTSGQKVNKGQLLFTIESCSYSDAVREAEASLATARSESEYAVKHLAAIEKAYKSDAVSEMELEQARNAERTAQASIKSAEAALSTARTRLGYCRVTAPITGMITDNILSVGNYVSGEGAPVEMCEIYDNSSVLAVFAIEDSELASRVAENLPRGKGTVPVRFTQKLDHSYLASYQYVAPDMDNSTGTLQIQLNIDNPYGELLPGMFVEVSLPTGVDDNAMLVRDASLSTDQLGKYLYVVNDSNRVVYTPVQIGELAPGDTMRIINSGLKPGDRYVTSALLKVRDGMTVHPVEPTSK